VLRCAARRVEQLALTSRRFGVRLTPVGSVLEGSGVLLRSADGTLHEVASGGFDHFRGGERVIRTAWVWLNALMATPPLSLLVIMGSFAGASGRFYERIGRFWVRWLLRASGVRVVALRPREHRARQAPDHPVQPRLVVRRRRPHQRGAQAVQVRRQAGTDPRPALGPCLAGRRQHRHRPPGHAGAIASLDRAARLVRADSSAIIIFPEGTRSPTARCSPSRRARSCWRSTPASRSCPRSSSGYARHPAQG
jgi:hypothetical protein